MIETCYAWLLFPTGGHPRGTANSMVILRQKVRAVKFDRKPSSRAWRPSNPLGGPHCESVLVDGGGDLDVLHSHTCQIGNGDLIIRCASRFFPRDDIA